MRFNGDRRPTVGLPPTRTPFMIFFRAFVEAGLHCSAPANRTGMAKVLAQPNHLNAPETVIEQVIGGRTVPDRIDF